MQAGSDFIGSNILIAMAQRNLEPLNDLYVAATDLQ